MTNTKTSLPKVKFPMDMTRQELDTLTKAAQQHGTSKKALIYSALKKAYGIDLEAANQNQNAQNADL